MSSHFEIRLPEFEGPFDLLLFFIERDELDIYNIPISKIADDFLGFLRQMTELNMEVASEFILVAASLMRIKVKMLLPRPELDAEGKELDPRMDLVNQLLEYKRYKDSAEIMKQKEEMRMMREPRGNIPKELIAVGESVGYADELNNLTLFKLLETYQKVTDRHAKELHKPKHTVVQYPYTMEGQKKFISQLVDANKQLSFSDFLLKECKDKVHLVFTFMAILELLQEEVLSLTLGLGFNNFWVTRKAELI